MEPIYNQETAFKEFVLHGEDWILSKLNGLSTIFDVGCNIGEWTRLARSHHPNSDIHMFEVVPDTFQHMKKNIVLDEKMYANPFGLSSEAGTLDMKYKPSYSAVSTCLRMLRVDDSEYRSGLVMKGDDYVKSRMIDKIDYLKVDVEGAEKMVFEGFSETLKQNKIDIIQFEYGYACILTKWLLMDAYELLGSHGFVLGKYANGRIDFHDYALWREDFQGPDYFAIHRSRPDLLTLLS